MKDEGESLIATGDVDSLSKLFDHMKNKETMLHTAIKSGHPKIVDFLLSRGLNPNQISNNDPAICLAARLNQCEIVGMLLKYGASVSVMDADKMTALNLAAKNECHACIKSLFRCMEVNKSG